MGESSLKGLMLGRGLLTGSKLADRLNISLHIDIDDKQGHKETGGNKVAVAVRNALLARQRESSAAAAPRAAAEGPRRSVAGTRAG